VTKWLWLRIYLWLYTHTHTHTHRKGGDNCFIEANTTQWKFYVHTQGGKEDTNGFYYMPNKVS
jgi:hypothetical protein